MKTTDWHPGRLCRVMMIRLFHQLNNILPNNIKNSLFIDYFIVEYNVVFVVRITCYNHQRWCVIIFELWDEENLDSKIRGCLQQTLKRSFLYFFKFFSFVFWNVSFAASTRTREWFGSACATVFEKWLHPLKSLVIISSTI